ncbi:hypothetical protein IFR05_004817 [Cadophora sp. M221]|nr:hypothetical protein IFR05_004817 [Cadophora sp. M221]
MEFCGVVSVAFESDGLSPRGATAVNRDEAGERILDQLISKRPVREVGEAMRAPAMSLALLDTSMPTRDLEQAGTVHRPSVIARIRHRKAASPIIEKTDTSPAFYNTGFYPWEGNHRLGTKLAATTLNSFVQAIAIFMILGFMAVQSLLFLIHFRDIEDLDTQQLAEIIHLLEYIGWEVGDPVGYSGVPTVHSIFQAIVPRIVLTIYTSVD